MSNQIQNSISIGLETAWGDGTTPYQSIPINFTGGIQVDKDVQIISSLKTKLAKNVFATLGNSKYEGEYEAPLLADDIGHFLYGWFGQDDVTGATPAFVHTFTEVEAKPSFCIEQNLQDLVARYSGSLINSLKFSIAVGQPILYTLGVKAKSMAEETAITPVYSELMPMNSGEASILIGGTQIPEMQTATIELLNNIEMKYTIGGLGEASYRYMTGSEVNVSFEGYLDATTKAEIFTKYGDGEAVSFEATMTDGTNTLVISVPKLVLTTSETPIAEDYNKITAEGKAILDPDTSTLVSAVLTNDVETYIPS